MERGEPVRPSPGSSGDTSHGGYRFADEGHAWPRRKRGTQARAVEVRLSPSARRHLAQLEEERQRHPPPPTEEDPS